MSDVVASGIAWPALVIYGTQHLPSTPSEIQALFWGGSQHAFGMVGRSSTPDTARCAVLIESVPGCAGGSWKRFSAPRGLTFCD